MKFFQTAYIVLHREIIRFLRDIPRAAMTTIQPILFLLIFGAGLQPTLRNILEVDFIKFIYPGILGLSIITTAFFNTVTTVRDREQGFLKVIFVAPVSKIAVLIGKGIASSIIATLQALLLFLLIPITGLTLLTISFSDLILFMILLSFAIAGLGLFLSSFIKSTEDFGAIIPIVIFPFFYMSGTFFPLENTPAWMRFINTFNPVAYGVDSMRIIIFEGQVRQEVIDNLTLHTNAVNAAFLVVFAVIMYSTAAIIFNRQG